MKLLVDMNLSPGWVGRLARHGFEAVHWSTIGAATAPDVEILTFANEHHFVVITNDLDFSAILAASAQSTPSVVQIRTQDLLSDDVVSTVVHALELPSLVAGCLDTSEGEQGGGTETRDHRSPVDTWTVRGVQRVALPTA